MPGWAVMLVLPLADANEDDAFEKGKALAEQAEQALAGWGIDIGRDRLHFVLVEDADTLPDEEVPIG